MVSKIRNSSSKIQPSNPFDSHFGRFKHNIVTNKVTSNLRPTNNTKRQNNIIQKSIKRSKVGRFDDFRKFPVKKKGKRRFNLSDDEEDNFGQSLSQIETFSGNEKNGGNISSKHSRLSKMIHKTRLENARKKQMNDQKADFLDELNSDWRQFEKAAAFPTKTNQIESISHNNFDSIILNFKSHPCKRRVDPQKRVATLNDQETPPCDTAKLAAFKHKSLISVDALDDEYEFVINYQPIPEEKPKVEKPFYREITKLTPFLVSSNFVAENDILNCLAATTVILKAVKEDAVFVPELVEGCCHVLRSFIPVEGCKPVLGVFDRAVLEWREIPLVEMFGSHFGQNERVNVVRIVSGLIMEIVDLYSHLPAFREVFGVLRTLIRQVEEIEGIPAFVKEMLAPINERIEEIFGDKRKHLVFAAKKVETIRQLLPQLGQKVRKSGDKRRRVVRDIRRESGWEARRQLEEVVAQDAERKRKTREIEKMLANQEGSYKASKRDRLEIDL